MRSSIAACSAPYFSQTGFIASWKRSFSSGETSVIVDVVRLHVGERLRLLRHPELALLELRFLGELADSSWSSGESVSQIFFEKTRISGIIRCSVVE